MLKRVQVLLFTLVWLSSFSSAYGDNELKEHANSDQLFEGPATPGPTAAPVVGAPTTPAAPKSPELVRNALQGAILRATEGLGDARKTVLNFMEETLRKATPANPVKVSDLVSKAPDAIPQDKKEALAKEMKEAFSGDDVALPDLQAAVRALKGDGKIPPGTQGAQTGTPGKEGATAEGKPAEGAAGDPVAKALDKFLEAQKKILGDQQARGQQDPSLADLLKGAGRGGKEGGGGKGEGGGGQGAQPPQPEQPQQAKKEPENHNEEKKEQPKKKSIADFLGEASKSNEKSASNNNNEQQNKDQQNKDKENGGFDLAALMKDAEKDKDKKKDKKNPLDAFGGEDAGKDAEALAAAANDPSSGQLDFGPSSVPQAIQQSGGSGGIGGGGGAFDNIETGNANGGGFAGGVGGTGGGGGGGALGAGDLATPGQSYDGYGGGGSSKYNSSQSLYSMGNGSDSSASSDSEGSGGSAYEIANSAVNRRLSLTVGGRLGAAFGSGIPGSRPALFEAARVGHAYLDKKRSKLGLEAPDEFATGLQSQSAF